MSRNTYDDYKVGDKVVVDDDAIVIQEIGLVGTVVEVSKEDQIVRVRIDTPGQWHGAEPLYRPTSLTIIRPLTAEERIEALETEVEALRAYVSDVKNFFETVKDALG